MGNHIFWYIARTTGLTAYLLLFVSICLGLLVRSKSKRVPRWRSYDLHQVTSLLATGFVVAHVLSLLGDQYIGFSLTNILVPLTASYRPVSVAVGIVGLYGLIVVTGSFYVRRWIGYKTWRSLHYFTFAVYILAWVHGLFSGTDTLAPWAFGMYWVTGTITAGLLTWRISSRPGAQNPTKAPRTARPAGGGLRTGRDLA